MNGNLLIYLQNKIRARDFDHGGDPRATIAEDKLGFNWNRYVHANALINGFDIYKQGNYNYYILLDKINNFRQVFPNARPNPRMNRSI